MWFKQVQLFRLTTPIKHSTSALAERLEAFAFQPCLPSMPTSMGWVSPLDEDDAPLVRSINGCHMICLQIEEKILPASVIARALKEKVKQIELSEGRKVRQKEKLTHKDETIQTLLPRAFSKLTKFYAYIDSRNQWLVLNTTSPGKTDLFISMFKKALGDMVEALTLSKPAAIMTDWLKNQSYPTVFSIEPACVLQDPNKEHRVIRCQQQDLFSESIQTLLADGCEAVQIGLCWQDRLNFVLANDFSLRGIKRTDDDLAEINDVIESKSQKLDADLFMMTEMLTALLKDLLGVFVKEKVVDISSRGAVIPAKAAVTAKAVIPAKAGTYL